jgi:hypothetical protein
MATYYWVGGNGTWDTTTTTNWAASSGGAGGAGVPTAADSVIFDAGSGASPVVTISSAVGLGCTIGAPTSGTLTLAFGASSLTLAGNYVCNTTISVTGTGTINLSSITATFTGGGNTYYNVAFTSTSLYSSAVNGANTFNNLSFPSPNAARAPFCLFDANQVINGTLTCTTPGTGVRRMILRGSPTGTRRTLTCAAVAALTDVDFQSIEIAGAAAPVSGTRLGNCLNNSGVTFSAPKTVYWNLAAGGNVSAAAWATSSGGAVATTNFPLAQDTAIIEDTGLNSGATITHTIPLQYGNWDSSSRTLPWNFSINGEGFNLYGSLKLANCTLSGTSGVNVLNNGTNIDIQSGGTTFTQRFTFFGYGGAVRYLDNFTSSSTSTSQLTGGTLDLNGYLFTCDSFVLSGSAVRGLAFGATGKFVLTGNNKTIWGGGEVTNLAITGTAPLVQATYAGATGTRDIQTNGLGAGGTEAKAINFDITAGTDTLTISGSGLGSSTRNVNFTGFAGTFGNPSPLIVFGDLTLSTGMTVASGTNTWTFNSTAGVQQITTSGRTVNVPLVFNGVGSTFVFQDALTQLSTRAFTITNGTVQLRAGATSTVGAFATSGATQKFLQSTIAGSQATLSQASGTVSATYLTIQDINATGGATWNSYVDQGNIDAGNNDGWDFGISPIIGSYEYTYSLRSFTQPRRF